MKKTKKSNKKSTKDKAKKATHSSKSTASEKGGISAKIRPLGDRIVIKEDTESVEKHTTSGIIIPITVDQDKGGKRGEVVAVGVGRYEDGKLVKPAIAIGDIVIFQWGDKVKIGDDEYYVVRESEILAVVK